jgi:RimJ/RimL family protein N-acetyltransferase
MESGNHLPIYSERLIMRMIQSGDADQVFQYRSNAHVNQYQGWIPGIIEEVHYFISHKVAPQMNLPGTWAQWVIIRKDTQQLIGDIGIHFLPSDSFQAELGCTLDILHQGNGFATEALSETINFLFDNLNKRRIIASIDPRNRSSIRLFERLGFRKEAHFKESLLIGGEWVDDLVYAILKEEWEKIKMGYSSVRL